MRLPALFTSLLIATAPSLLAQAPPPAAAATPPAAPIATPTKSQVPPKGVAIPEADRAELEAGIKEIRAIVEKLSKTGNARDLLPDVEVLLKAVEWPLKYDEFFNVKDVGTAKTILAEARKRAESLQKGEAPWTTQTGPVVRAYRSKIDGSVQPYGIVVPASYKPEDKAKRPVLVFNHGRGETSTELSFIAGRMKSVGDLVPAEAFVIHPYGRFCNATKFAGETDVFEALEAAQKAYPINEHRVAMTGFSMGGASTWHLATHFAWKWAVTSPGAGFAETPIYTKAFAEGKEPPPWWEQQLWHLYNATDVVENLQNTRMIAYSGEIDPQKQSADLMEKAAAEKGFKFERLIGPQTAHKYEPETKKELLKRIEEELAKPYVPNPPKAHLVTYTLQYNRQAWLIADGLEEHWKRSELLGEIKGNTVEIKTENVSSFTVQFAEDHTPFANGIAPKFVLDGQELAAQKVDTKEYHTYSVQFQKLNGKWFIPEWPHVRIGMFKSDTLHGPIDHAFMTSFLFVRPTGKSANDAVDKWTREEMERAIKQWRTVFRGDAQVVDDTALTQTMIKENNLILWGDPQSNSVLGKIAGTSLIKWDAKTFEAGGKTYPSAANVPILIYPNPLKGDHYIVVNSSFTFRQGSNTSNALQTPKLPDWAVVDISQPKPADKPNWPGVVVDAGFFDEAWQFKKAAAK